MMCRVCKQIVEIVDILNSVKRCRELLNKKKGVNPPSKSEERTEESQKTSRIKGFLHRGTSAKCQVRRKSAKMKTPKKSKSDRSSRCQTARSSLEPQVLKRLTCKSKKNVLAQHGNNIGVTVVMVSEAVQLKIGIGGTLGEHSKAGVKQAVVANGGTDSMNDATRRLLGSVYGRLPTWAGGCRDGTLAE